MMKLIRWIFRDFIAIQQITHNECVKILFILVCLAILKKRVIVDGIAKATFTPSVIQLIL